MSVVILVPVLGRPGNVAPLLDSIARVTRTAWRTLFIVDPGDTAERDAVAAAEGEQLVCSGSYARKINYGIRATTEPLIFLAADDLHFQPRWLDEACARLTPPVQVVGVNDCIRRRHSRRGHATHFLMTRDYANQPTIDGQPGPLYQGYAHNFVDDELIATARKRGVYAYAPESVVEHRHPMMGTAPDDDTYQRGRARFDRDRRLHQERISLWT